MTREINDNCRKVRLGNFIKAGINAWVNCDNDFKTETHSADVIIATKNSCKDIVKMIRELRLRYNLQAPLTKLSTVCKKFDTSKKNKQKEVKEHWIFS